MDYFSQQEFWNFFNVISEPANKATLVTMKWSIKKIQAKDYRSGETSLALLEEDYMTVPMGMRFTKFSPLFEIYNKMLGLMESNGLMEYWRQTFKPSSLLKVENIGPEVLTMDHLKVGFLTCLIPLILSIIAFVGEKITSKLVPTFRKLFERFF